MFKFSHLLIRELIKGLSPSQVICSTFSREIHYIGVQSDSKQEEYYERIIDIFTPTNQGLIQGLSPN